VIGEPGGVLFRAATAYEVGGFDASQPYLIDLDYWFRLLLRGDAYYTPERLASFRVSKGSWSVAIGSRQRADFCNFIQRIARNPRYAIRGADLAMGRLMAYVNNASRLMFYRFAL
jgi:hypothetical protein